MDKKIPRKKWNAKLAFLVVGVALLLGLFKLAYSGDAKTLRNIAADRITVSRVVEGVFEEYVPILGTVRPKVSVFLDLAEGGIVREVYVDAGNAVEKGDPILYFTNTAAQKQNIDSETRLLENLDRMRSSKLALTEKNLQLKEQLLDLDYQILELDRTFERYGHLVASGSPAISQQEFETTEENLDYLKNKRELLKERMRQESALRETQNTQIDKSILLVNESLEVLTEIKESLKVRSPISGFLSSMNAEIGQSFSRGQRVGQVDQLDEFKVRAEVDQYYISKVAVGQVAKFEFGGDDYFLTVDKVYPEVLNEVFEIDLEFQGAPAVGVKRGQTLQIDLSLSKSVTTMMANKGGFYRHTNGRWAYRIAADRKSAERVEIVAGRQNPQFFEILDGLNVGDELVTSSYEGFNDVDILTFDAPVVR